MLSDARVVRMWCGVCGGACGGWVLMTRVMCVAVPMVVCTDGRVLCGFESLIY